MKNIRIFERTLRKIESYREAYRRLSDEELKGKTAVFRARIQSGESTDALLPEAYAAICEADRRVLGMYPYDSQIQGAIALHRCYLAQMQTGEGKTLTATMPLYLNALTGQSSILVTANDYLALRDAQKMGPVYAFMGMTIRAGVSRDPELPLTNEQKKENYLADILYTTHSALAFDYLLEHLVKRAEDRFLRKFYYVIIDEADSVLLDGAQMPLVISGAPRVQSNLYQLADFFVSTLKEGREYEVRDKSVWLTDEGVAYAQRFFGVDAFYARENFELNRQVTLALRARALFLKGREYMCTDQGQIVLLDNATGRSMPGMKLRGGQQQALEAREKLEISQEQRSVASVTYQNLFLMFPRMAGMSGTIADARAELWNVYRKQVVCIPTHKPVKRMDLKDRCFQTAEEQFKAAISDVLRRHADGQPVLVVTNTIQDTEMISQALVAKRIPHSVLNASNAFWEAQIIAEAGKKDAITVSTGIAGRGTDIRLGAGVRERGGLAVIGVGRMQNVRLEKQARGRAGRQGDPGVSQFYVSLEDDVTAALGEDKIARYVARERPMPGWRIRHLIHLAQKTQEEKAVSSRELSVRYDKVMKRQREILYAARDRLLDRGEITREMFQRICRDNFRLFLKENRHPSRHEMNHYLLDNLSYELGADRVNPDEKAKGLLDRLLHQSAIWAMPLKKQAEESGRGGSGEGRLTGSAAQKQAEESGRGDSGEGRLTGSAAQKQTEESGRAKRREGGLFAQLAMYAQRLYVKKVAQFDGQDQVQEYLRACVLQAVDDAWIEEVDYLQQLQVATLSRGMAQKNPVFEYNREAYIAFTEMEQMMKKNIMRNFFLGEHQIDEKGRMKIIFP